MSDHALSETHSQVLSLYNLPPVRALEPITEGLIHQTYAVSLVSDETLILQRLHPLLNTEATLEDFEAVTAHLEREGYGGPKLVHTAGGERAATDQEGGRWRLSTFVPGVTRSSVEDLHQASLAGEALATFHKVMSTMQYRFKSPHPGHDTRGHWERLRSASVAPRRWRPPWRSSPPRTPRT